MKRPDRRRAGLNPWSKYEKKRENRDRFRPQSNARGGSDCDPRQGLAPRRTHRLSALVRAAQSPWIRHSYVWWRDLVHPPAFLRGAQRPHSDRDVRLPPLRQPGLHREGASLSGNAAGEHRRCRPQGSPPMGDAQTQSLARCRNETTIDDRSRSVAHRARNGGADLFGRQCEERPLLASHSGGNRRRFMATRHTPRRAEVTCSLAPRQHLRSGPSAQRAAWAA